MGSFTYPHHVGQIQESFSTFDVCIEWLSTFFGFQTNSSANLKLTMKIRLTLILLTISVSLFGQTSVYHPFPDSNAVWVYSRHEMAGTTEVWKIILSNGDTTLNTQTYRKVYSRYPSPIYFGGMRQEIALRKVFFIPKDSSSEQVLYDFNLSVGDTIPSTFIGCYPQVWVASIDSTNQFGNGYRKVFNMTGAIWAPYSLIEGIGGSGGVFVPYCMNDGYYYQLDCYSVNDTIQSSNPWGASMCSLSTNVADNFIKLSSLKVSPNPFHSTTTLELKKDFENAVLKIYNIFGDQVQRQKIISQTTIINRNGLRDGIYLFQIISSNGKVTIGKLMLE